jgi:hypothetical protein
VKNTRAAARANPSNLLKLRISSILPYGGVAPGKRAFAIAGRLTSTSQMFIDGAAAECHWVDIPTVIPLSVAFRMPVGTPGGSTHQITAFAGGGACEPFAYVYAVAPRNYRGWYGWQSVNFGDPTIRWEMYRDFFGTAAVMRP